MSDAIEAEAVEGSDQKGKVDGALPTNSSKIVRRRDRNKTRQELELAMLRIKERGKKLSITAVAVEAGITPGLIHNTYPDIAEAIRVQVGRSTRQQRDDTITELSKAQMRIRELTAESKTAAIDIRRLTSTIESLRQEVAILRAMGSGKVVVLPSGHSE